MSKLTAVLTGVALVLSAATGRVETREPDAAALRPAELSVRSAVSELAAWADAKGGKLGAAVLDTATGKTIAEANSYAQLNPASNQKLLTAAVALDTLGPQYRFVTGLYGTMRGKRVDRLVLRGHGDPSLEPWHLWRLAQGLAFRGVAEVGTICVDQSRFDDRFVPPAFEQQPDEWAAFRAPVSAVALSRNTLTLNVIPTRAKAHATVWLEPPGIADIQGAVVTRPVGGGQRIGFTLDAESGVLKAELSGHIAEGLRRVQIAKRVDDPRLIPGRALAFDLKRLGVNVSGQVALCGEDEKNNLVYLESLPLSLLLQELGKHSDNFYAEMLLKVIGAETKGTPATSAHGAATVVEWLRRKGAYVPGTRVVNGSGLFDANRISARALVQLLHVAYGNPKIGPDFVAQLAIGGVDGTLRSRFKEDEIRGHVRAKTGTLRNVVSLSGYLFGKHSAPLAFSFIVQGESVPHTEARARIDRAVSALLSLSR